MEGKPSSEKLNKRLNKSFKAKSSRVQLLKMSENRNAIRQQHFLTIKLWKITLTCFQDELLDPLFILTTAGYFITKYLTQDVKVPQMPPHLPSACTGLITFLLVFYVTSCYNRFKEQYDAVMKSVGSLVNVSLQAHDSISWEGSWALFRYLNAAHILSYVGLETVYDEDNIFQPHNEKYKLLNEQEMKKLKDYNFQGGAPFRVLLSWCVEAVRQEFANKRISEAQMKTFLQLIFELRGSFSRLYHFKQQPVPFSYVLLVNMMVSWFLPFYGVSIGYTSSGTLTYLNKNSKILLGESIAEFLYIVTYAMVVTGLKRLGQRLQDPLGNDLEDFDINSIVTEGIYQTEEILRAPRADQLTQTDMTVWYEEVYNSQPIKPPSHKMDL